MRRIRSVLASGNLDTPTLVFDRTVRRRKGIPSFSRGVFVCSYPGSCKADTVIQWLRTKACPQSGCNVTAADAFYKDQQKLVDTLLVTDLLSIARNPSNDLIVVVTEDDDMVPSMLVAASWKARVQHLRESNRMRAYDHHLRQLGIGLHKW